VRPPAAYTNGIKKLQLIQYGFADKNLKHYEQDHLIAIEMGGNPRDPRNEWPQHRAGKCSASQKDRLENAMHKLICAHKIDLAVAQFQIAHNWIAAYQIHVDPKGCR